MTVMERWKAQTLVRVRVKRKRKRLTSIRQEGHQWWGYFVLLLVKSMNELFYADILADICLSSSLHVFSMTNTILACCLILRFFSFLFFSLILVESRRHSGAVIWLFIIFFTSQNEWKEQKGDTEGWQRWISSDHSCLPIIFLAINDQFLRNRKATGQGQFML